MKLFMLAISALILFLLAIPALYLVGVWHETEATVQRAQDNGFLRESPVKAPLNVAEYVIIASEFPGIWDRSGIACRPAGQVWSLLTGSSIPRGKLISTELGARVIDAERTGQGISERIVKVAMAACMLDARYSDTQMLRILLRRAYFGLRQYGLDAASFEAFGRPPEKLDIAQSARLAAYFRVPSLRKNPGSLDKLTQSISDRFEARSQRR